MKILKTFLALLFMVFTTNSLATTYNIGPGQTYPTISSLSWNLLKPGDLVNIHYAVYHEKLVISQSGTADKRINIVGIPDSTGHLPVLDGTNATTAKQFGMAWKPVEAQYEVFIDNPKVWPGYVSFVNISRLEIRGAYRGSDTTPLTFTDENGTVTPYQFDGCGILVQAGRHLTIKNCKIHDNGNGLFVSGNNDNLEIYVLGNYIYNNGNVGRYGEHNVYTEARGIYFKYNHFGPIKVGAVSDCVKDRSAGTVFTRNLVEGGQHCLDLVDPQANQTNALADPRFKETTVTNNIFIVHNGDATSLINFGGDTYIPANDRFHLTLDHNTFVVIKDQKSAWYVCILKCTENKQSVDITNNIVYVKPQTVGSLTPIMYWNANMYSNLTFGKNVVSKFTAIYYPNWMPVAPFGVATGASSIVVADPLLDTNYWLPNPTGPAIGLGGVGKLH